MFEFHLDVATSKQIQFPHSIEMMERWLYLGSGIVHATFMTGQTYKSSNGHLSRRTMRLGIRERTFLPKATTFHGNVEMSLVSSILWNHLSADSRHIHPQLPRFLLTFNYLHMAQDMVSRVRLLSSSFLAISSIDHLRTLNRSSFDPLVRLKRYIAITVTPSPSSPGT